MLSKRRSEKKSQKRRKKRSASFTVKTVSGVGPFKKKKTRHQNIRKSENETGGPNTPDEPKGTVADLISMRVLVEF